MDKRYSCSRCCCYKQIVLWLLCILLFSSVFSLIYFQSADVTSIKKTLENGVCSNRAYSPGTVNGNGGFLKSKTKTENKHIIKSYQKGKTNEKSAKYHPKRARFSHPFTMQSIVHHDDFR